MRDKRDVLGVCFAMSKPSIVSNRRRFTNPADHTTMPRAVPVDVEDVELRRLRQPKARNPCLCEIPALDPDRRNLGIAGDRLGEITDATMLQQRLHMAFGGVLILLLGLELMATVRMYLKEHVIHVEAVFLVALIAVARQVIELDYAHASVGVLVGIAAILLALSGGYFLLRKSGIRGVPGPDGGA